MRKKKRIKYLIVAQIENKGFLLKTEDTYKKAKKFADVTVELAYEFSIYEMHKVERKLTYFASYTAAGNDAGIGSCKYQITNGVYTVTILEIDLDKFRLKMFLRERENHSNVFDHEEYNEQLDRLLELFPHLEMEAN